VNILDKAYMYSTRLTICRPTFSYACFPWQCWREWREQVVDGPSYDHIVVDSN